MLESLVATRLEEPQLRFSYADRKSIDRNPYSGLRNFGPYDAETRRQQGRRDARVIIVAAEDFVNAIDAAKTSLSAKRLGKLHDVYRLTFVDQILVPRSAVRDEAAAYRTAINEWFEATPYKRDIDLAIVLHRREIEYKGASPYYAAKAAFMRRGIPTQSICYDNLAPRNIGNFQKYYVANILTATYAKIGGVPWVVAARPDARPEITIGVATTAITLGGTLERYVGISTIFDENGAFALWDITQPEQDWSKYETQLEKSLVRAIETYEARENRKVLRIVCHVSGKRAGKRERDALGRALARFPQAITSHIIHVTEDSPLWLMNGAEGSLMPASGILVDLKADGSSAMLHTEGLGSSSRFLTRPLKLGIFGELPEDGPIALYQHLYDLRWMSWRGVRTSGGPVSVAYPKKMAYLLAYLYEQEDVGALEILSQLTSKAWFL